MMRAPIAAACFLLAALRRLVDGAVVLLFVVMATAVIVQVLGRYLFNFSIAGAEEIATIAQIWMVLLAAGLAMRRGLHVGVDLLIARAPAPLRRAVLIAVTLLALWFLWVVFDGSFSLIRIGRFQTSPALQLPMAWAYWCLPIGTAYFALELLLAVVPRLLPGDRDGKPA